MKKIRILIADDHAIMRIGLKSMLGSQPDMSVVGEAENGQKAVELVDALKPDVTIMDLMMPVLGGAEATARIVHGHPETKVIVLTSFGASQDMAQALANGACGAQMKEAPAGEIIDAVRAVIAGQNAIAQEIQRLLNDEPMPPPLTEKQTQILGSIVGGSTNKDIARQFGLSEGGVKKHLRLIFSKLGATTRSEAASIALRKHLLKM